MPDFFRFDNKATPPTLYLYGDIGFDDQSSATAFVSGLRAVEGLDLAVRVNSDGGSVTDGLAVRNLLKAAPQKKTFYVDGIAASIASVIITAGPVVMAPNALLFLHDPIIGKVTGADAEDLREIADTLDLMRAQIVKCYAAKSGADAATINMWLDADTYFTAEQAVEVKLADSIGEPSPLSVALNSAKHLPRLKALNKQSNEEQPMTEEEKKQMDALSAAHDELKKAHDALTAKAEALEKKLAEKDDGDEDGDEDGEAEAKHKAALAKLETDLTAGFTAKLDELKAMIPARAAIKPGSPEAKKKGEELRVEYFAKLKDDPNGAAEFYAKHKTNF